MAVANARSMMRQNLQKKTEEQHARKDSSGIFKTYFNDVKMEGISRFNPGKATYIIDIIPYVVGTQDPHNKPNDVAYVLDVLVHMGIGPADERIVCLAQFGKPCPVCDKIKELNNQGADYKTVIKPLVAKRRTMYNVIVRDNGEEEKKGVQVMEMAHFFMEKNIAALSKNPRTGGYTVFSDPDNGKSISFRRTGVGADNTGYDAYQFIDRPGPITDAELDSAKCLDDLILIRSYDEILSIVEAIPEQPEEEPTAITQPQDEPPEPEPPQEPVVENIDQQQLDRAERRRQREEAAAAKAKENANTIVCPVEGGTFGKSIDEYEECDTCPHYDACEKAMADN